jgi:hypothetical protein
MATAAVLDDDATGLEQPALFGVADVNRRPGL